MLTVTASYQRHMQFFLTVARSLPDLPDRQLKPAKPDTDTQPFPLHRPGILAMASVPIGAVDEQSRCARESQVKIDSTSHVQMEPCRWRLLRLQPAPVLNHVVPHLLFSTRGCAVLLKGTRENHLRLATFAGNINCADSKNKSGNECQHVRSEQFLSEEIQKHCTKKKMTITGKKNITQSLKVKGQLRFRMVVDDRRKCLKHGRLHFGWGILQKKSFSQQ